MPQSTARKSSPSVATVHTQSLRINGPVRTGAPERPGRSLHGVTATIGLTLLGTFAGAGYYFAPMAERVRSPLHPWLRPSGYVGQSAGIVALLIFLFLWLYPLRKRFRRLAFTGSMARWLDVHVALALVLPFIGAIHASWRFEGLIGLGFLSMMIVWASGIAGRYLYVHIPRSASGLELSAEEIAAERRGLLEELAGVCGLPVAQVEALLRSDPSPCDGLGFWQTAVRMLRDDLDRWRAARRLRRATAGLRGGSRLDRRSLHRVLTLARREMSLTQQARMLEASHRIFRFWHVVHRPFAVTALAAVLVHVGVVVAMGATWFW
jgi:hypothetical protein